VTAVATGRPDERAPGSSPGRRAVITGIGVVAPTGIGVAEHWNATLDGRCRIGPLSMYEPGAIPLRLGGEVAAFDENRYVDGRLRVQTDRWTWMGLAATELALTDAGLDPAAEDPLSLSVITASGSGGNHFGQREIQALWSQGPRAVSAYQSIGWFYAASSGQISIRHQLKGQCGVLVSDGAGAIDAVAAAVRVIRRGGRAAIVGGTEAPLSPYAVTCQLSQPRLSRGTEPATAYRPFAAGADGFVPGEGGAMLVVEEEAAARARGALQYAEIVGSAATHDAHDPQDPPPDHTHLLRAMALALRRAGTDPADVDVVFADGAGDPRGDQLEAAALRELFGDRPVPVTVPKTMTGRLCSGGAALDLAWAALALAHGVVPPTVNVRPDPQYRINVVTTATPAPLRTALIVGRGTGGFNAAAVLRRSAN
jgi:3-oxoacyl-(acyl-carrier-protein) synthase